MVDQPNRGKTLEETKAYLLERTLAGRNPMDGSKEADVREALTRLKSDDPDHWAEVWMQTARPYEEAGLEAEGKGDDAAAHDAFMLAYQYYRLGRFPAPNSPGKIASGQASIANYLAAARYFDPPLEVLNIPFAGAAGEGPLVRCYLRKPAGVERPPVVIHHGGIDSFKEERHRYAGPVLGRGWASLAIDMPGTSESPVKGALDGERVYEPVLAHLRERSDVDGNRVALVGGSFGGYWATKVAHVYHDQFAGVVNWGGGVHYGFQPDWINASRYAGSYLTDLLGTRAFAFGLGSADEWLEFAPKLSMLDSGVIDGEHAPMLLVNGKDDAQTPIADLYLLLEHGAPKDTRVFPGGHMGQTPDTYPTILRWIEARFTAI
jgi:pimeloyl-ACP methyl ester carboxylesterase